MSVPGMQIAHSVCNLEDPFILINQIINMEADIGKIWLTDDDKRTCFCILGSKAKDRNPEIFRIINALIKFYCDDDRLEEFLEVTEKESRKLGNITLSQFVSVKRQNI